MTIDGDKEQAARAMGECWAALRQWVPTLRVIARVTHGVHQAAAGQRLTLLSVLLEKAEEVQRRSLVQAECFQQAVDSHDQVLGDQLCQAFRMYHKEWMKFLAVWRDEPAGAKAKSANIELGATRAILLDLLEQRGFSYVTATFNDPVTAKVPADDTPLWRYMDKSKFIDLMTTCSLYLCRIDRFGDSFEGSVPVRLYTDIYPIPSKRRFLNRFFFASCWHINPHESVAMWELYLRGQPGVAIQTTSARLQNTVLAPEEGRLDRGCVTYADYTEDWFDALGPVSAYFYKRIEYEHEKEFRLLYHDFPPDYFSQQSRRLLLGTDEFPGQPLRIDSDKNNINIPMPDGVRVPIDLSFIQKIVVHAGAAPPFFSWVRSIVDDTGYGPQIVKSSLEREPRI